MLTLYNELLVRLKKLYADNNIAEINATIAVLYVDFHLGQIKQQSDYLPVNEIKLLQDSHRSLPKESEVYPYLVSALLSLVLLFDQRDQNHRHSCWDSIETILHDLPCEMVASVHVSPTLSNLLHEEQLKYSIGPAIKPSFERLDFLVEVWVKDLIEGHRLGYREGSRHSIQSLVGLEGEIKALIHIFDTENLDSKTLTESFRTLLTYYRGGNIDDNVLTEFLRTVLAQTKDQKRFVQYCLRAYQAEYAELPRNSEWRIECHGYLEHASCLIRGAAVLLQTFGEELNEGELGELLINRQFFFSDPDNYYCAMLWGNYLIIRSIFEGNALEIDDKRVSGKLSIIVAKPEKLFGLLRSVRKGVARDAHYAADLRLHSIPPGLQHFLEKKHSAFIPLFIDFLAHYYRINDVANDKNPHQQRNVTLFFIKYEREVQQLIGLIEGEAIQHMQRYVANTVLPLERMLQDIPLLDESLIIPLKAYFATQVKTAREFETFKLCLITIGTIAKINTVGLIQPLIMSMARGKSSQEFLESMVKFLLNNLIPEMDVALSEESIQAMFERMPPEKMASLFAAGEHMQDEDYREIYLEFLKRDLLGGDINAFLHDTTQESLVGQDLAHHNQAIRATLLKHGIIPEEALEYRNTFDFIALPEDASEQDLSQNNQYVVLWSYLNQLRVQTAGLVDATSDKIKNQLRAITKNISEFENKIQKQLKQGVSEASAITSVLGHRENLTILVKIMTNCEELRKQGKALSDSFHEFAEHVHVQYELITDADSAPNTKDKLNQFDYFSVEQWSKDKIMTFFLGDEVGCCLATNNTQFQAMVQRRMDDAMLFHVAIDKITGKPAALIWLYLAQTDDNQIVLMANFFEVKAKFGLDDYKRKTLVNALLKFTNQYLEDNPGISGLYMNPLSYGWNFRDLNEYPLQELSLIDKVGGPYIPYETSKDAPDLSEDTQTTTCAKYYLVSLNRTSFHEFDPEILVVGTQHNNIIPIAVLIHKFVSSCAKENIIFDELVHNIITQHGVQLGYFYGNPLHTNQQFLDELYTMYETANISYHTQGKVTSILEFHGFFSEEKCEEQSMPNQD